MKIKSLLTVCCVSAGALLSSSAHASDAEMKALRAEIQALQSRLDKMDKAASVVASATPAATTSGAVESGKPVLAGSTPNSIIIPGTNTTLSWSGMVKADLAYDISRGYGANFVKWGSIPLDSAATSSKNGEFNATARQTRIGFGTETPTEFGPLKVFVETDFYASNDASSVELATNPNGNVLRHAYGQLGRVLIGQTWSTFWDQDSHPDSLDYAGPVGVTIVRQVQARYTQNFDKWTVQAAIENPYTDYVKGAGMSNTVSNDDAMPDLTGAVTYKDSWGHVSLRSVARRISVLNETLRTTDSATGYGFSLSGKIKILPTDEVRFRGVYGQGVGRYLYDLATSGNGSVYTTGGLKAQPAWGGYVDYQHKWTDALRSNLMGGYLRIDNDQSLDSLTTGNNRLLWSTHANLIWQVTPKFSTGAEFMHGGRTQQDGQGGHLNRVMVSGMYNF